MPSKFDSYRKLNRTEENKTKSLQVAMTSNNGVIELTLIPPARDAIASKKLHNDEWKTFSFPTWLFKNFFFVKINFRHAFC